MVAVAGIVVVVVVVVAVPSVISPSDKMGESGGELSGDESVEDRLRSSSPDGVE